jgi:2-(1,2-epoxy-1,2-dihydrophenyl)acetyl-CoA isomerase
MPDVEYEFSDDIATIRLNRPSRLNAVTPQLVEGLVAALNTAESDNARAVLLQGNGRSFCAGHDLQAESTGGGPLDVWRDVQRIQDITRAVRRIPAPVIAVVHGYALGAGCEFALCSDLVIAADSATFGFPEVGVGLSVTGGISHVLPMAVGFARAKQLLLLGERFSAQTALEWGLINEVVPADELEARSHDMARRIAERSPLAVAVAKQAIDMGPGVSMESALAFETYHAQLAMPSGDAADAAESFRARTRPGLAEKAL